LGFRKLSAFTIGFGVIILTLLVLYVKAIEYFVVSPYALSSFILANGRIPQKLFDSNKGWNAHANNFVNYPAAAIIISFLSMISGLDAYLIIYLPILIIVFIIMLFSFVRILPLQNREISYLIFLLLSIYIVARFPNVWNLTYHSLGYVSHLMIMYLVLKKLYFRGKKEDDLVMSIMFLLSLFSYYSTTTFTIVLIFALIMWSIAIKKKQMIDTMKHMLIIFVVSYAFYDFFAWRVLGEWRLDFGVLIEYLLAFLYRFIMGQPASEELYPFGAPYEKSLLDILLSRATFLFSALSPIVILLVEHLGNTRIDEDEKLKDIVIILSSLTVAVYELIPYVIVKMGLNWRYLSIFTPIVTLFIASKMLPRLCKATYYKKILCLMIMVLFVVALVGAIKIGTYNSVVEGLGSVKGSLVKLPEYEFFAKYACCNVAFYSNFQVSAELRAIFIKVGKAEDVSSEALLNYTYTFYNIIKKNDSKDLDLVLPSRSVIVITTQDLYKPVYGAAWGYATPPFSERIVGMLDKITFLDKFYSSGRIYAYYSYYYS